MPKFYNIYDNLGKLSTDSCTPFNDLDDALNAAAPRFADYQHTIQINEDTTVEVVDYQIRVEAIFEQDVADAEDENQYQRQVRSDYYSNLGV